MINSYFSRQFAVLESLLEIEHAHWFFLTVVLAEIFFTRVFCERRRFNSERAMRRAYIGPHLHDRLVAVAGVPVLAHDQLVELGQLADPLLDHAHVAHQVAFSHPLRSQETLSVLAVYPSEHALH